MSSSGLFSPSQVLRAYITTFGQLQVAGEGAAVFTDQFNGNTLDTTYNWNAAILAGGGTAVVASGRLQLNVGTTASNAAEVNSQEYFQTLGVGAIKGGSIVIQEAGNTTTGLLPTDVTYFFLDNIEEPIASAPLTAPQTIKLPIRLSAINHTVPPAVAPTIIFYGLAFIDTGSNYNMLYNGQTAVIARSPSVFIPLNAVGIAAETTIWTPPAGLRFRLLGYMLETGTVGGNVLLKDGTGLATVLIIPFGAANAVIQSQPMGNGILSGAANRVLTATGGATQTLSGYLFGCYENGV